MGLHGLDSQLIHSANFSPGQKKRRPWCNNTLSPSSLGCIMTAAEFKTYVLPCKRKLFVVAFRMVGQAQDAEDIVQEAMIKLWEQQQPLSDYRNLEAYLMTLVRNRSLDRIKFNGLRRGGNSELDVATSEPTPERELEQKESVQEVRRLVRALPENQREMLILRDFVGYTYQDIAEITGLDMARVKVGIHRARKALKALLVKNTTYGIEST